VCLHQLAQSAPCPHLPQVRIARLLWAVARKDGEALQRDLEAARSEVMGPFSGGLCWPAGWLGRGQPVAMLMLDSAAGPQQQPTKS
jgi:hypothetical protein